MVSTLLRDLIHALETSQPGTRDDLLIRLTLDELTPANTQALSSAMFKAAMGQSPSYFQSLNAL